MVRHDRPAHNLDRPGSRRQNIDHQVDVLHILEVRRDRPSGVDQQNGIIRLEVGQDGVVGVAPMRKGPPRIRGRRDVVLPIEQFLLIGIGAGHHPIEHDVPHTGGFNLEHHNFRRHRLAEMGHDGRIPAQDQLDEHVLWCVDHHISGHNFPIQELRAFALLFRLERNRHPLEIPSLVG